MLPKYLYKFEKITEQTLRNLKNAQIYFNAPVNFNDPFDCSALNVASMLNDKTIVDLVNKYLQDNGDSRKINSIEQIPQKIRNQTYDIFEQEFAKQQNNLLHNRGCTCFSELNDNILLWSHYADGHKGICLEFDASYPLFSKAKKVNYSLEFPVIDTMKYLYGSQDEKIIEGEKTLITKHELWNYEKEWRLFHKESNKLYGYSTEALNSVYFGLSVRSVDIEIICLILQGQNHNIKFYKANKDKSKYAIWFEEFAYTPHIKV